jgi:L-alanine-DL-glutamate epimerase-like enolase superfamily enzyme
MSDDDWRVEVELEGHGLLERRHERKVAHDARERLGEGVTISVDAHKLFAYAPDEAKAREAASTIEELATREKLSSTVTLSRWHPIEQSWQPPEVPLPVTEEERAAEHQRFREREREESREAGYAEWEVELQLPSDDRAEEVAAELERDGGWVGRRGHKIVLGAETEDDAAALAERMRAAFPDATSVEVKGSEAAGWSQLKPFPYLGGLGG